MSAPPNLQPILRRPQRPLLRGLLIAVPVSLLAWGMLLVAVALGPS